jgi:hypothetical protein
MKCPFTKNEREEYIRVLQTLVNIAPRTEETLTQMLIDPRKEETTSKMTKENLMAVMTESSYTLCT